MIIESIFLIILICSIGAIILFLIRKVPALHSLPINETSGIREHHIILNLENKIKGVLLAIEKQIFFHKFLSWVKVMTLKVETKVDKSLHKIRKKAQQVDKDLKDKKLP